jgi:hypothetical protein
MNQNLLFATALGLMPPWKVVDSGLKQQGHGAKHLYVDIDLESGARMPCPRCGQACALYDHEIKTWRHLNFWQHATVLSARVPRRAAADKVRRARGAAFRPSSVEMIRVRSRFRRLRGRCSAD